jgi:hypothetical protein
MHCPYCNSPLVHWDKFGRLAQHQDGKVTGEILICPNDETCESESVCNLVFHIYNSNPNQIKEGMPC